MMCVCWVGCVTVVVVTLIDVRLWVSCVTVTVVVVGVGWYRRTEDSG